MRRSPAELESALDAVPSLVARDRPIALFLDYDGTLTEIVLPEIVPCVDVVVKEK